MQIRRFAIGDAEAVLALWRECDLIQPWNDPHQEMTRKLEFQGELFLVGTIDGKIVATVMAGYEGHRGWLNYVGVAPKYRRLGLGRLIVSEAEKLLRSVGCPTIHLRIRATSPEAVKFYERLGYSVDNVVSMGKRFETK
jgi:ribosomal protein S18 acetylase RimI-like enzyme